MQSSDLTQRSGPTRDPTSSVRGLSSRPLIALGVIVAILCGALAGWIARDATTKDPQGVASAQVTKMLNSRMDALNRGRATELASLYAPKAVLTEQDRHPYGVTVGSQRIADHLMGLRTIGFHFAPRGTVPIRLGSYVAEGLRWWGSGVIVDGIAVYKLSPGGRIVHQWVIADAQ